MLVTFAWPSAAHVLMPQTRELQDPADIGERQGL